MGFWNTMFGITPKETVPGDDPGGGQALWIFGAAGLPFILAGGVQMFMTGQSRLLYIGIVLGIIPTILIWVLRSASPLLMWSLLGIALIGLVVLGASVGRWLGWWDWERKADRWIKQLKEQDGFKQMSEEQQKRMLRTIKLMDRIGSRSFDPQEAEIP